MKFVNVRELRIRPGAVWKKLRQERELVITSRGKPVAVLADADEASLESTLNLLRRARAMKALDDIHARSSRLGLDRLTMSQVNEEIEAYRTERRAKSRR